MKNIFFITGAATIIATTAHARTLHYGEWSVPLTDTQKTFPALHIRFSDNEMAYGALYSTAAPANSLRIMYDGTEYWVGNWCEAGTYQSEDKLGCTDCGIGHYCAGGTHRAACTGGAIACPGKNHTADATAPAELVNKILTLDEVNENIPATEWNDWKHINCCGTSLASPYYETLSSDNDQMFLPDTGGCPITQFGPGTYLFITHTIPYIGVCHGFPQGGDTLTMAVISQPSSYRQVHAQNFYRTIIDTTSIDFKVNSFRAHNYHYCSENNDTNISGINIDLSSATMCVYELK